MPEPMLKVEGVSKTYGDVRALDSVTLSFSKGEIHAVLGENGAGKSTLMGVLAGFVVPDSGSVTLDGSLLPFGKAHETKSAGIEMVHQHFMLVQEFTVLENLALSQFQSLRSTIDLSFAEKSARQTAERLGWEFDFNETVRRLPVGAQQRVEILKALGGNAEVLIFDEPTAVLSPDEVEDLFRVLRVLRDEGKCVILIAHKLSEVLSVADRVSVLRQGKFVASAPREDVDAPKLANWMVGDLPEPNVPLPASDERPLVEVQSLTVLGERGEEAVRGLSVSVSRGEILGIGGVDGNGQPEFAEALAGAREISSGEIVWNESSGKTGFIPQDRQGQGLALSMSVVDNYLITAHSRKSLTRGPFLLPKEVKKFTNELVQKYEVKVGCTNDVVGSLSGGNQQKVVVSRVLAEKPDLIVAHNPTRGLDIRATAFVRKQLLIAAQEGAAVILISTDHDELAELASHTVYMSRGQIVEGGNAAVVGGAE